ncbi:sulfate transporter family-domain-containing protein [Flagelloscypha sp. PMI_526]|nr:sulfate transporter family-domain-containing protein [Flagelloscypha sp. PMI_526]
MSSKFVLWGKNVIGHDDNAPPVIKTKEILADQSSPLFPILGWITRYNFGWLTGDLIAGITVGVVLVPQGMGYATIATLAQSTASTAPSLASSPILFATSKDVSIGPVAVMSLTVAQVIKHVQATHGTTYSGPVIATVLSFITGFITLGIGLLRLGWIIEYIPAPAVSGFMTGSAITIVSGQVPTLMGITGFDTRAEAYKVIINTLKGLPRTTKDAAFGLMGLATLYFIRWGCSALTKRYPRRARMLFFVSVCRHAFVIVILTIGAWLYAKPRKTKAGKFPIKLVQDVPRGLKHVGVPPVDLTILKALASEIPVSTIILLLEHIAISKSFGRLNGYTINPNQELIAIGVANTCGSCFGAYPNTGSFSRTALKSKSGVRTPLAGVFTSLVIIVALYGLTPAFYYIPSAGISAVVIHAVADLVASPDQVYAFWRISPVEFIIWAATVLITVFSTIENGIYTSICASLAFLLVRLSFPRGHFLGRAKLHDEADQEGGRDVFVPFKNNGIIDSEVAVVPPAPGVLIYRFEESFLYPNASALNSTLVAHIKKHFKRGRSLAGVPLSDRPWNDPGPPRGVTEEELAAENEKKDDLRALVLDFSTVSHVDVTSAQLLIDTRREIERWVDHPVEFHFATILTPWIRRSLVAAGFGTSDPAPDFRPEIAGVVPYRRGDREPLSSESKAPIDEEAIVVKSPSSSVSDRDGGQVRVVSSATPFFHVDLQAAVRAAERNPETLKVASEY